MHPSDEAYGSDRIFLKTVAAAQSSGRAVRVLLPDDTAAGWLSDRLGQIGVPVRRGPLAPARRRYLRIVALPAYVGSLVRAARFVRSEARGLRAGIIYVNTSSLLAAALVGRPGRARLVWHVHELVLRPRVLAWAFRWAPVITADRVIAISEAVRAHLTPGGIGKHKVVRIYNGIEPFSPVGPARRDPHHPRVAFIGRLNRWKGYDVFLHAVSLVAAEFPSAEFHFLGSPPPGEEWRVDDLSAEVERLGLADRTTIAGFRDDLPDLLGGLDVVAAPSVWPEPFGLVLLEAMSAGCAVVASNHGAAPELVEDGRSGLLVRPSDAEALAQALRTLLGNPGLRARLGVEARERASRFTDAAYVSAIQRLLVELDGPAAGQARAA